MKTKNNRPVICIETKITFASGREAAKANEVTKSDVSLSARKIKAVKGLNFRFLDENGNPIETPAKPKYTKKGKPTFSLEHEKKQVVIHNESTIEADGEHGNGNAKAVWCVSTNEVFASVTDTAKAHEVSASEISKCCNGKIKDVKGKYYVFISKTSENVGNIVAYVRELQAKANNAYEPEYLAWKAEKAKAARKAELEQLISTCKANICELEVKTAHEYEMLEAFTAELEQLNANAN